MSGVDAAAGAGSSAGGDGLRLGALVCGYGKVEIVRGVDLLAPPGAVTCVFGPNGSGKSTLLKSVVGLAPIWGGSVHFGAARLDGRAVSEAIGLGVAVVNQGGNVFPQLTVRENLRMGAYVLREKRRFAEHLDEVLSLFPALAARLDARGSALSGGQRMLLSVAQALITRPRFLLLDEPSAGLAPVTAGEVFGVLATLRAQGKGILLVEQNVREALGIADRVYVLVQGRVVFEGAASEVPEPGALVRMFMQT